MRDNFAMYTLNSFKLECLSLYLHFTRYVEE